MNTLFVIIGVIGVKQVLFILLLLFLIFGVKWLPRMWQKLKDRIRDVAREEEEKNRFK